MGCLGLSKWKDRLHSSPVEVKGLHGCQRLLGVLRMSNLWPPLTSTLHPHHPSQYHPLTLTFPQAIFIQLPLVLGPAAWDILQLVVQSARIHSTPLLWKKLVVSHSFLGNWIVSSTVLMAMPVVRERQDSVPILSYMLGKANVHFQLSVTNPSPHPISCLLSPRYLE